MPVLAAHWGLERYGLWSMLIAVPGLLLLSDLGFATAATVRMTMEIAQGRPEAARKTMHSASSVVLVACAVILAAGLSTAAFVPDATLGTLSAVSPAEVRGAIMSMTAYAVLICGGALLQALFRSNLHFATGSLLWTAMLLVENGLLVAAVVQGHGLVAGAVALLLGRLGGIAAGLVLAIRLKTGVLPGLSQADRSVRGELLKPALAAMAIPLGVTMILQGQVVALGLAAGAMAVPAFVATRTLSRLGLQIAQAIAHPIMPEFGAAAARADRPAMTRYFALVLLSSCAISAIFALPIALAGPQIIAAWSGGHISAPAELTRIMALSALFGGIWNPVSNLLLGVNQQKRFSLPLTGLAIIGFSVTLATGKIAGSSAAAMAIVGIDLVMLAIVLRFAFANWGRPAELARAARLKAMTRKSYWF